MHVLIPEHWFYREEESQGTKAFFVSKESIDREGQFKTGLTTNMISNIRAKTGNSPSDNAARLFDSLKKSSGYQDVQTKTVGEIAQLSGVFRVKSPSSGKTIVQYVTTIANNKTGTLHIVQFESLQSEWDKNMPIAKLLMTNLVIDETC